MCADASHLGEERDLGVETVNGEPPTVDAEQSYWLYIAVQALQDGRFADNEQLDEALLWLRDRIPTDTTRWSSDGKKVLDDVKEIIDTARLLVKEKNADEIIQNFMHHASSVQTESNEEKVERERMELSQQEVKKGIAAATHHLRTLFKLLATNNEARGLLSDLTLILREFLADAQEFLALFTRPRPEELARIDRAASPSEQEAYSPQVEGGPGEPAGFHGEALASNTDVEDVESDSQQGTIKKNILRFLGRSLIKRQKKAREEEPRPMYPSDGILPPERKRALVYRFKKVIIECQTDPAYQASLLWLTSRMESYFGDMKQHAVEGVQRSKSFFSNPLSAQAASELRIILERCANGQSMGDVLDAIQKIVKLSLKDEKLRDWWSRVNIFVKKSLYEPGFILEPEFGPDAQFLTDQFFASFRNYSDDIEILLAALEAWFNCWGEDPLIQRLSNGWSRLVNDLFVEDEDVVIYKPQLGRDFRRHVLPGLMSTFLYIPAPRIEYTDDQFDVVMENIILQGPNMVPKIFNFKVMNDVKISPFSDGKDEHNHVMRITMSQMYADMQNVAFYFSKRGGFPRITDAGLADVRIGGKGITVKVTILSTTRDRKKGDHLFVVKKVSVKIDKLKFVIRDSKYNFLYNTLVPLATRVIKKHIARTVADIVRTGFTWIDSQFVGVRGRMAAAEASDGVEQTKVLKEALRPSRIKASLLETHALKNKKDSGTFRFVPIQPSMLRRDPDDKTRWIRKQDDEKTKAFEDQGWRSDAFTIRRPVSAEQ